jgi:phosphoglycerol transferase
MKVALLNAFPNLRHSAEREFIERCVAVLGAMGHEAHRVVTSDDTMAVDPDVVIVTHDFVAKTTDHYTVGLLWSPTTFYKDDEERLKAIRSWDLVVPINAATRRFAKDLHFPTRHDTAVSGLDFFPSAPLADLPPPDPSSLGLAYVGAHWDGQRHGPLLQELARRTDLHVYGPEKAWTSLPEAYRGPIPFDGHSLVRTLNRHGIVLALHKPEHVQEETPSMRVFEACAARCVVVTERMQPLLELFGDTVHTLEGGSSPARQATEIADIVAHYRRHPDAFMRAAARTHEVFRARASLEHLLGALLSDVETRRAAERVRLAPRADDPTVTVIIRCGSRPLSVVQRAVASLAAQTYHSIGLLFVRFDAIDGFAPWLEALRAGGRFVAVREVTAPGGGLRSASMWAGLRAVDSELFSMLDDDDELFRDHLASLVEVLRRDAGCDFAFGGGIRQEEDGAFLNDHPRFKGDLDNPVPERRALRFLDDFNLDRLLRYDNMILSHSWVARRRVLDDEVLADPALEVGEDVYLYLLLASRHRFRHSGRATVLWNWRSRAGDNSMLAVSQQRWARCAEAIGRRLAHVEFPGGYQGRDILGTGRVQRRAYAPYRAPQQAATRQATGPRGRVKTLLRLVSGERAFLSAADAPPGDPGRIVHTIDFTQPVLPAAVANVRGLSTTEPWGCWTDGPRLVIEFRSPLPPRFAVHLIGHAFRSCHLLPVRVTVGLDESVLRLSARLRAARYEVALDNQDAARVLEFHIPKPARPADHKPGSGDTRQLGLALVRLDIVER